MRTMNPRTMKVDLHVRVVRTINHHAMIRAGERVGIGVSAGADSVALLRIFSDLQSQLGISLVVLHFHHQLRGVEADQDEAFVAELARNLGIDFIADRADVAGEARRNGWNVEDAARRMRYQFFAMVAASHHLHHVAVAHTADDQAETVLAHILRGTGSTGLAGIYPVAGLVIRPLLDIRRRELRDYLNEIGQPWREDATNRDTARTRAKIRHNLIPLLERDFEPSVVSRLARLAGLAREEESFWRALADERFSKLVTRQPAGELSIKVDDFLSPYPAIATSEPKKELRDVPSLAVSRRLVRRICFELAGTRRQLTARHVEDVLHLASESQSGARLELPGITVERVFDRLMFAGTAARHAPASEAGPQFEYTIDLRGRSEASTIVIPEIKLRFSLKVVDWSSRSRETRDEQGTLDFDCLRWPLTMRNWHPGDSYRPHRRLRAHKLKQLLLEARIPPGDRAGWPVLTCEGELVWAPMCPAAEKFATRSGTRFGLVISEVEF
jgi:tRNA(Ile)-lysidine synthase